MRTIYDLTVPVSAGLAVWDGDPPTIFEQVASTEQGDAYNLSRLDLSGHAGTHVDAPRHVLADGAGVDRLPLDALIGPCQVWAPPGSGPITAAMLPDLAEGADRLLIKTFVGRWWEAKPPALPRAWRALTAEAAHALAGRHTRLVGVDAPSIDAANAMDFPIHRALLGGAVVVVESLDLSRVEPGVYKLVCLPLRLVGLDGAPARAVLLEAR